MQEDKMKQASRGTAKIRIRMLIGITALLLCIPINLPASEETDAMKKEIESLQGQLDEMDERLNKTELHSATDKVSFGVEFRTRADSIHYSDIQTAPSWLMAGFFTPVGTNTGTGNAWTVAEMNAVTPNDFLTMMSSMPAGTTLQDMLTAGGFNGATRNYIQSMMAALTMAGAVPDTEEYDTDNDLIYTNKFRLNMDAKINQNLSFSGRLAMYKVYGDSSEV